jgi:hypothetical protein
MKGDVALVAQDKGSDYYLRVLLCVWVAMQIAWRLIDP